MSTQKIAIRHSVRELQEMKSEGNSEPLDNLVKAWKGIKDLPYNNNQSFFMLGGYHGEPFEGSHQEDPKYWGGYCNHANVLFPTWHRIYVRKVELALQSIIPGVMLPYWDETSEQSRNEGIPSVLTNEKYTFSNGEEIDNPLRSFVFPIDVLDPTTGAKEYTGPVFGQPAVKQPTFGTASEKL
jgi:tyrosinase